MDNTGVLGMVGFVLITFWGTIILHRITVWSANKIEFLI